VKIKALQGENSPLLLLIPILVYYLYGLTNSWIPSADSAVYISLAKSLIMGQGYAYMGYTQVRFPFFYPLILAPVVKFSGMNFLLLRSVSLLLGIGSLGLIYIIYKRIRGQHWGIMLMLLTAASEFFYLYCHHVLSDITYTFFSLLTLWYFLKDSAPSGSKSRFITAGLLLAAYFTRSVGVILFIAVFLFEFFERGKKQALVLALIFLIPSGLWSYRNRTVPLKDQFPSNQGESVNYFDEFFSRNLADDEKIYIGLQDIGERILRNSRYYREIATDLILPYSVALGRGTVLIPLLLVAGFCGCWFKYRTVIEYYVSLYVLAYLLWPSWQGVRFYVPILPFLLYYLFSGILLIANGINKGLQFPVSIQQRMRAGINILVVILLLGMHLKMSWQMAHYLREKSYLKESTKNFFSSIQWITDNTRPDAIFIADRAPWVYLLSKRRTYGFARVPNSAKILQSMLEKKSDYMILSNVTGYNRFLDWVFADYPHLFHEVYRKGDSAVYRIIVKEENLPPS